MAMTLVAMNVRHTYGGKFTQHPDLTKAAETIAIVDSQSYTHGTGANQANQPWGDSIELAGAAATLDLTASLVDSVGNTITFLKIKELRIKNTSTTAGENITISGNFMDNGLLGGGSSTVVLGPGGTFHVSSPIDGYTVTVDTGDKITVDPGDDTITYKIWMLGVV